ncbi:Alpha/Beta hydrolase fold [Sesbania bispinosa]|nr:Alpha/Beta hydrolase fold [Sesbania bispinosa]
MVNLVTAYLSLLRWVMKMAGVRPYTLEIEPGTVMRFWVPEETISKPKLVSKPSKPVVVLLHGFCGDGIMTWQFQVGTLTKKYAVYVPDLLFFGGSGTDKPERSPGFQAECLVMGLRKLGVEKCVVVGFSYGEIVALKMGELYPEVVQAIVISGFIVAMMDFVLLSVVQGAGYSSLSEMLLPTSANGVKSLLSVGAHRNLCLPNRLYKDFLEVCPFKP